ncbi:MAG TPA: hypothetical protein VGR82_17720 [Methylomirabilota bacterium]|jgi:hypothetical protein|nr:hypothetical protein [Methylomirabilota bacterium]
MLKRGTCRWCKCTDVDACPGGCAWVDSACTLCSACEPINVAWKDEKTSRGGARPPNMRRAFFTGFLVGARDARDESNGLNPYSKGAVQWGWWRRGQEAGAGAIPGR